MLVNHGRLRRKLQKADSHHDIANAFCECCSELKSNVIQSVIIAIEAAYALGKRDLK